MNIKNCVLHSLCTVGTVSVGFETNFTAVPEDIGSFELCVSIRTPMITISENVQFSLNLFSVQDTAGTMTCNMKVQYASDD